MSASHRIKRKCSMFHVVIVCPVMLLLLYQYGFCLPTVTLVINIKEWDAKEPQGASVKADEQQDTIASFQIQHDLDWSARVPCGGYKCFFRSKSNNQVGYLAMREKHSQFDNEDRFKMANQGWNLARDLERRFGIQHFLLESPFDVKVTQDLASTLNRNLWSEEQTRFNNTGRNIYPKGSSVLIQKCRIAPEPHLLMGSSVGKLVEFEQNVDKFVARIDDKVAFAHHFNQDLTMTRMILEEEPCLMHDFQVMVDVTGRIFQIDFDRCFDRRNVTNKYTNTSRISAECNNALKLIEHRVQRALDESSNNESTDSYQLLQDIDLDSSKQVPCGHYKCFFPSKSDSQLGYLVSRTPKRFSPEEWIQRLSAGWHLAKEMERKYGINNFLLEPPINVTVTSNLATRLNQNLWSEKNDKSMRRNFFRPRRPICIQASRVAPQPSLLIGCDEYKSKNFIAYLEEFMVSVEDRELFADNLRADMAKTRELLVHEPSLLYDFQVLVDTNGRVFHIDLDRAFINGAGAHKRIISNHTSDTCYQSLDKVESEIYQAAQDSGKDLRYYIYPEESISKSIHVLSAAMSRPFDEIQSRYCCRDPLSELAVHQALEAHSLRTMNPNDADFYIVPTPISLLITQGCFNDGENCTDFDEAFDALTSHPIFINDEGKRHIIISLHWLPFNHKWEQRAPHLTRNYPRLKNTMIAGRMDSLEVFDILSKGRARGNDYERHFRKEGPLVTRAGFSLGSGFETSFPLITPSMERFDKSKFYIFYRTRTKGSSNKSTRFRVAPLNLTEELAPSSIGYGLPKEEWLEHFSSSQFCLVIRGDTPESHAFPHAIRCGCIPVVISDWYQDYAGPLKSTLNMSDFSIMIQEQDFIENPLKVLQGLKRIERSVIERKIKALTYAQQVLFPDHPQSLFVPSFLKEASNALKLADERNTDKELPY